MIKLTFYLIGGSKMTISMYDKFALLPIRCDKCNRLFIFEWYNIHYRQVTYLNELKIIKCKECVNKDRNKK